MGFFDKIGDFFEDAWDFVTEDDLGILLTAGQFKILDKLYESVMPEMPEMPEDQSFFPNTLAEAEQGASGIRRRHSLDPRVNEVDPFGLDDLLSTSGDASINLPK